MGRLLQILFLLVAVFIGLYVGGFLSSEPPPLSVGEGWWAASDKATTNVDTSVRPFKIAFSDGDLKDLKQRLNRTRWFDSLEGTKFEYGTRSDYMKKLVEYWKNDYDWKKQEKVFNQFKHFKTNIEGIDIHFLHVKPKVIPEGVEVKPLLMVHGWPGSFYEFYSIIPMLTDPTSHGGSKEDTFEVICPSLPGFGFSEASHRPGLNALNIGRIFGTLMTERLDFKDYYVQGGDWGGTIVDAISSYFPQNVRGHHSNMAVYQPPHALLSMILGSLTSPSLIFSKEIDQRKIFPVMEQFKLILRESGYFHIQATKPDTIGHGLTDSPVGLAAYILEKFCTFENKIPTEEEDCGLGSWKTDDLLNNIMIYWVSGSITSAIRLYKETVAAFGLSNPLDQYESHVPLGVASFPHDLAITSPECWLRYKYKNIVSYIDMPTGGHFAAFEQPELLAKDIRQFVRKVEEQRAQKKQ